MMIYRIWNQMLKHCLTVALLGALSSQAETNLANGPLLTGNVTGNVALSLSVEWPTATSSAYKSAYDKNAEYIGYFDPDKCYAYSVSNLPNLLYNTGVNSQNQRIANGTTDPNWRATRTPAGLTATQIANLNRVGDFSDATSATLSVGNQPAGDYEFSSNAFTFPSYVDLSKVSVSFDLVADDSLKDILINGRSTGIRNPAVTWYSAGRVVIPAGSFTTATNILTIAVPNASGPTGIRVFNMRVSYAPEEGNYFTPMAMAANHTCNGYWSGNLLNWALTQTIDSFRAVLTGGYRSVDTPTTTVLEKAWFSNQTEGSPSLIINNNQQLIRESTPYSNLTNLYMKIMCSGNQFYFSGSQSATGQAWWSDCQNGANVPIIDDPLINTTITVNSLYRMFARVEVCDVRSPLGVNGLESNCVKYNSNYKPEGLIQQNSQNMNFAAFGYLNDSAWDRQGGVLRARMAPVGPIMSLQSGKAVNPRPEWDINTGVYLQNPVPADISGANQTLGVNNSGVINYLNKFGQASKSYKSIDPVGELYYATTRYLKNQGNVPTYTNAANATHLDGFPAITNWDDPIKYSCQPNFIIGLGDTNSWYDNNQPGSTVTNARPMPAEVSADRSVNARIMTNQLGYKENVGYGNLGERSNYAWGCCFGTYMMAGVAYDSHINDIRPDLIGKQTVNTYWLDVLTLATSTNKGDGFDVGGVGWRNHFWLTAKYGGFTGTDPSGNTSLARNQWDTNNDGDPDNYFRANNPALMRDGLAKAFASIANTIAGTASGMSVPSPNIDNGGFSYNSAYNATDWTGDVIANIVNFDAAGNRTGSSPAWYAANMINNQFADNLWTNRIVSTANCTVQSNGMKTCTAVPFRFANVDATTKAYLQKMGTQTVDVNSMINYQRGDKTNENSLFRMRKSLLGDIVNSKIRVVGPPIAPYGDDLNPGYASFKQQYARRSTLIYVGANDGMLHAIDAQTGRERFAFIPNAVFAGPDADAPYSGLAAVANPSFIHHMYVDGQVNAYDVNFSSSATGADWRSVLIAGLGKGGKSYVALDVTNPDAMTNETNVASKFLWEFSHKDMGYSYASPLVVKAGGKWLAVLTSGYNNADGRGYFFIVDVRTGALLAQVPTGAGGGGVDAGLSNATAYVSSLQSFNADAVYAGDLLGNVWRLDLSGAANNTFPAPVQLARLTSPSGAAQPITAPPLVEIDQSTNKRYVFVGTGKFLADADISSTQIQSFYAINDGNANTGGFYTAATLPVAAGAYPITRNVLVDNTGSLTSGVAVNPSKPMGYFIDLGTGTGGTAYRINTGLASGAGVVAFAANLIIGDICNASSSNQLYAFSYGSGKSVLRASITSGTTVDKITNNALSAGVLITRDPNSSNITINNTDTQNNVTSTQLQPSVTTNQVKTLNWRAITTTE